MGDLPLGWIIFFVLLIGGLIYCVHGIDKEHDRLMAECMKDHKEYECVSMLKSNTGTTVVPMPVVIRSR